MKLEYRQHITRKMLQLESNKIFVFGDNMTRKGFGGQAKEMRGEPNAVGIPTKWRPGIYDTDYFRNGDFRSVKSQIDYAFKVMKRHGHIVWPAKGVGAGYARLQMTAPVIWEYIENKRMELESISEVIGTYDP